MWLSFTETCRGLFIDFERNTCLKISKHPASTEQTNKSSWRRGRFQIPGSKAGVKVTWTLETTLDSREEVRSKPWDVKAMGSTRTIPDQFGWWTRCVCSRSDRIFVVCHSLHKRPRSQIIKISKIADQQISKSEVRLVSPKARMESARLWLEALLLLQGLNQMSTGKFPAFLSLFLDFLLTILIIIPGHSTHHFNDYLIGSSHHLNHYSKFQIVIIFLTTVHKLTLIIILLTAPIHHTIVFVHFSKIVQKCSVDQKSWTKLDETDDGFMSWKKWLETSFCKHWNQLEKGFSSNIQISDPPRGWVTHVLQMRCSMVV